MAFCRLQRTFTDVSRLKTGLTLLLAVLWLPMTVHCQLESIGGFEFLSCCIHSEAAQDSAHHDADCQTDSCATVEAGHYRHEDSQHTPMQLVLALILTDWLPGELLPPVSVATVSVSSAPPELPKVWQFSCRTALPPRAPSLAS